MIRFMLITAVTMLIHSNGFAGINGLGEIAKVEKRSDGLYNVVCDYGDVEVGLSIQDILSGRVCEQGSKAKLVKLLSMKTYGPCSIRKYEQSDKFTYSNVGYDNFKLKGNKRYDGCINTSYYKVPAGYRIAFKKVEAHMYVSDDQVYDVELIMSGDQSDGQPLMKKVIKDKGAKSHVFQFEAPIMSSCEEIDPTISKLVLATFAAVNSETMEIAGSVSVASIAIKDPYVVKCE